MTIKMVEMDETVSFRFLLAGIVHTREIHIRSKFRYFYSRICNGTRLIEGGYEISRGKFTTGTNSTLLDALLKASKNRSAMFLENDLFKSKTHVSHRWHRRILEKCEALGFPQENS